jgi:hypothetical protein
VWDSSKKANKVWLLAGRTADARIKLLSLPLDNRGAGDWG